ncbi:hypothetical protein [Streptomyces sp. SLBN-118]|uniref:hypothetical protein n=1 Tax=Streptomyces sp. SLBN-118 TaxID=2768454 RepID=UPI0021B39142|nr:hypothetical protein [Streptomyces sp. SLBN-118]
MNPTDTEKTTEQAEATTAAALKDEGADAAAEPVGTDAAAVSADALDDGTDDAEETPRTSGIGASAAAVVAAGLGVVALSGSWVGKVASERQTLIGQIKTSQGGTPAQQIAAVYGDAWHTTALVNGIFALLALIVGAAVLALPQKAGWVRAFAVAGVALGVLGMIVSAGMYFDLLLSLPTTGS